MPSVSAVLSMPYIEPSQAQKHVTHNEALRVLDVLTQLSVLDRALTVPPTEPALSTDRTDPSDAGIPERHAPARMSIGESRPALVFLQKQSVLTNHAGNC